MGQPEKTINLTLPEDQIWENRKSLIFQKIVKVCVWMYICMTKKTQFTILKFRPAVKETFPKEPDIIPG